MCSSGETCSQTRQRKFAPRPVFGGSGGVPRPVRTSKWTVFAARSTIGSTQASLPFFVESANERTSGIRAPQAGFGQLTVRAQSQAITVASPPPCSRGRRTFG